MQGLAETELLELAEKNSDFETVIIKCGYVLKKGSTVPEVLVGASRNAIRVDELAAAMVELAVMGSGSKTIGNAELRSMGKRLLKERKERDK
jgi:transcription initiation factor TFIIIB Brf1 subunit/transcription initiation factor TFIIB